VKKVGGNYRGAGSAVWVGQGLPPYHDGHRRDGDSPRLLRRGWRVTHEWMGALEAGWLVLRRFMDAWRELLRSWGGSEVMMMHSYVMA